MKRYSLFISLVLLIWHSDISAQSVGISDDASSPDPSAMLDVQSDTKGVLIPRMTLSERNAIVSPADGLLVFDTDVETFWYYTAGAWRNLQGAFERVGSVVRPGQFSDPVDFVFGAGALPGAGSFNDTMLFFDQSKGAFRGGVSFLNYWSPDSIGEYSFAYGQDVKALGEGSTALGRNVQAIGDASLAVGRSCTARGYSAIAMGFLCGATGDYSFVSGLQSLATGFAAMARGSNNTASGDHSIALGTHVDAQAYGSVAIGRNNVGWGTADQWIETQPLFEIGKGTPGYLPINAFTVLKNGNTGINTAFPAADLQIDGDDNTEAIIFDGGKARIRHSIDLISTDRDFLHFLLDANDDQINAKFALFKDVAASAGQTPVVNFNLDGFDSWINTGGDLGINTIAPTSQLTIKQAASLDGNGLRLVANASDFSWEIRHTSTNDNLRFRAFDTGGSAIMTSEISSTTGNFISGSDVRLKKHVNPLRGELPHILALTPSSYLFKHVDDAAEPTVGLIAQEVQEHFPGLVEEKQDGMLGLNYDGIAVLAIQAVKEQQVVIDTQNDRIAKLEAVVRELLQEQSFMRNDSKEGKD